jgi:hypothetical protein
MPMTTVKTPTMMLILLSAERPRVVMCGGKVSSYQDVSNAHKAEQHQGMQVRFGLPIPSVVCRRIIVDDVSLSEGTVQEQHFQIGVNMRYMMEGGITTSSNI